MYIIVYILGQVEITNQCFFLWNTAISKNLYKPTGLSIMLCTVNITQYILQDRMHMTGLSTQNMGWPWP